MNDEQFDQVIVQLELWNGVATHFSAV